MLHPSLLVTFLTCLVCASWSGNPYWNGAKSKSRTAKPWKTSDAGMFGKACSLRILNLGVVLRFLFSSWVGIHHKYHIRTNWCAKDVSYTKTPDWIKLSKEWAHDPHTTFWTLARFAYPETRNANLAEPRPSPQNQVSLPPDEHLLCYDYIYYVCLQQVSSHI